MGTMFGKLEDKMVCVGSVVLKRKQELSAEKAAKANGNIVDLKAIHLEGYGLEVSVKRLKKAMKDKQFFLAADGDMKVH